MNDNSIMLSVIITFCNQKLFVYDCLRSILKQETQFSYEILIDGKDDGIMAVLEKYASFYNNIKVWKVQSDARYLAMSRASHNRLFLLSKARGRFFIVLDGDDFFCDIHRFEEGVTFLLNNKSYIGHACEWIQYDHKASSFKNETKIRKSGIFTKNYYIEKRMYIHVSCFIYRNIFKKSHIIYKEKDFFDDPCISHFMLMFGPVFFNGKRMFGYRVNIESTFFALPERCQWLLQVSTYTKIYDITKHWMNNSYAAGYIKKILDENNFEWPENIKRSIIFQDRMLAKEIVQLNDMNDIDKKNSLIRLKFFCDYWINYRNTIKLL